MKNTQQQSSHWIDKLVKGILKWGEKNNLKELHVDDMKTPSGRVHVGSLRGVVLHDFVAKALALKHDNVVSTYVFNDMDPMDGLPHYLDKKEYDQHMGKPLYKIPAPPLDHSGIDFSNASKEDIEDFKNAKSMAEFYSIDFQKAFRKLNCDQDIIWSHQLYESGQMDSTIRTALDSVDTLKKIYKEVANYDLPEKWYPFQVTCPQCGKVGTTLVTVWDGKEVTFECQEHKVEWAKGCGYKGKISPFGGTGKLLWKVDWPAHWTAIGVNIEGSGKDHCSAGGSKDMGDAVCREVFKVIEPFNIPYEFLLLRGAKMSSSKGVGTSAREFVELFPVEVGRFLFANKHYNSVIDFDPNTDAIPDLFDEYDQAARIYWGEEQGDTRMARAFELSQIKEVPQKHFIPRFRDVALWMQHPEINLLEKFVEVKGSELTAQEKQILEDRKNYAQIWLNRYAAQDYQLTPTDEIPAKAKELTDEQKEYLQKAIDLINQRKDWDPQELQQAMFELAKESLGARKAFQAVYLAFIGKTAGPRAAWFLLAMDKDFREKRIKDLLESQKIEKETKFIYPEIKDDSFISIDPTIKANYPNFFIGAAIIKGIKVKASTDELLSEINDVYSRVRAMSVRDFDQSRKIRSYKQAIKQCGVDVRVRRPTMEALMRRLAKGQNVPSINNVADIGNLIAVKHEMSSGVFDLNTITTPIVFKEAKGGEQVLIFGDKEPLTLQKGEICYFDQEGPFAIDLCWRDAQRTSLTEKTTNLLVATEGVFDVTRQDVEAMLKEMVEYVLKYAGGKVEKIGIIQ